MTKKEAQDLFSLLSSDANEKAAYTDEIQILSINEISRRCVPTKLFSTEDDDNRTVFRDDKLNGDSGHIFAPILASNDDDKLDIDEELVVASVYFATALCAVKEGFQNKQNKKAIEIIDMYRKHLGQDE